METTPASNLIQHRHVVQATSRPRITIGPKSDNRQTQIQLKKSGEQVESIEITCACGERIVIQCEY